MGRSEYPQIMIPPVTLSHNCCFAHYMPQFKRIVYRQEILVSNEMAGAESVDSSSANSNWHSSNDVEEGKGTQMR